MEVSGQVVRPPADGSIDRPGFVERTEPLLRPRPDRGGRPAPLLLSYRPAPGEHTALEERDEALKGPPPVLGDRGKLPDTAAVAGELHVQLGPALCVEPWVPRRRARLSSETLVEFVEHGRHTAQVDEHHAARPS